MIPKIIHYCWFGKNPLSDLAKKCIDSWKKYCPDYEIIEWNEENFDINSNVYVKEAYDSKKWAFVTDYVRLYALDKCGGIYMDTDVELLKGIDVFLENEAFSGFETSELMPTAIMGSVEGGEWIKYLLSYYDDKHFIKPDGTLDVTTNVTTITNMTVEKYGVKLDNAYQEVENVLTLYPKDYFCPKDYRTGLINLTDNTICIHHFNASWHSEEERKSHERYLDYVQKYGIDKANKKISVYDRNQWYIKTLREKGALYCIKKVILKIKFIIGKFFNLLIKNIVPIGNVIFFESEGDFADNARALYEYLIEKGYNEKYRIVWNVKSKDSFKNIKVKNVKFISAQNRTKNLQQQYYISRARYFFFTHPYWLKEWKKGQTVINLWHGIPLKGQGRDLSNTYDIAVVTSEKSKVLFSEFIGAKEEQMIIAGNPRNDLMFRKVDISGFLIKHTGKVQYDKIILSMPTFRQGPVSNQAKNVNPYSINTILNEKELIAFNDYLHKCNILLIAKIHHLQDLSFLEMISLSNILYITDDELHKDNLQLYELVGKADCLLTDFSSIYFDYLLLNRPIGFYINDINEYSRGFLVDNPLEYMPGKNIKCNDELYSFVDSLIKGEDEYAERRKQILDFAYQYRDDKTCERLVKMFDL